MGVVRRWFGSERRSGWFRNCCRLLCHLIGPDLGRQRLRWYVVKGDCWIGRVGGWRRNCEFGRNGRCGRGRRAGRGRGLLECCRKAMCYAERGCRGRSHHDRFVVGGDKWRALALLQTIQQVGQVQAFGFCGIAKRVVGCKGTQRRNPEPRRRRAGRRNCIRQSRRCGQRKPRRTSLAGSAALHAAARSGRGTCAPFQRQQQGGGDNGSANAQGSMTPP